MTQAFEKCGAFYKKVDALVLKVKSKSPVEDEFCPSGERDLNRIPKQIPFTR